MVCKISWSWYRQEATCFSSRTAEFYLITCYRKVHPATPDHINHLGGTHTVTVCCIHQFLRGKDSHFSRMPWITENRKLSFSCVKTKHTHTHINPDLHELHRNNSCLLTLHYCERSQFIDSMSTHWMHAVCTQGTKGKGRSAHATYGYSDTKDVARLLFVLSRTDFPRVSWMSSLQRQHSTRATRHPSCGEPVTVTTSISSTYGLKMKC